ncbi:30S ribosomal subunit protein S8 [Wigglesworthia glossinidia endosymbiont of Glossina morsitans morsitans (Yale colony)]|uniref:Small ribosomal subunit protein uS8 n=1 Tax=Wigglesworthia glossinidia endosymbiont of Glossina morsitans morsitans (Yale colony) TaxID=1142511 RepID=H6Q4H9_WIGGL|nr:30S ribosomal protein S8 [Wigglesworthia glossinidia]AFA41039.1 30S ribosomal subunit protein S8 [Wigglesworthia glossinidia endosymbiont of Glossina morsitans morsitans (Yale colony)]
MSLQDPIADMLTRIRNGQISKKKFIYMPSSNSKISIANVLKNEGFIESYEIKNEIKPILKLVLKYFKGTPVIEKIKRISSPGLRIYKNKKSLPQVKSGMGIAIISTSKGIMTDKAARNLNLGGEIICYVE